jgi:hypothetical protein
VSAFSAAIFRATVGKPLQITPPFPTNRQPGDELVQSRDSFPLGDTIHATSAAISPRHAGFSGPVSTVRIGAMHEAERSVERVNLLKLITSSECRPRGVRSQYG